ncbi:MAG: isochorismatase family protein [Polyangiaceae bacterium]
MKPALLVIDLQNEFFDEGSPALSTLTPAVEYVNAAIALFRKLGHPIVVIRDIEEPTRVPGAPSFEVHSSVQVHTEDLHIDKRHGNAFWQTDLEEQLRSRNIDFLVLTGFAAEYCVLNTYRGATERGFSAALLRGSIAGPREDHIPFVERICDVISYGPLEHVLTQG